MKYQMLLWVSMVKVERQSFDRWTNAWRIANDDVELFVPESIGPRVMCLPAHGRRKCVQTIPRWGEGTRGTSAVGSARAAGDDVDQR